MRSHLVTEHLHSSQDHPNGVLCEEARILPILRKNAGEKHWTAAYRFLGPTEVSVSSSPMFFTGIFTRLLSVLVSRHKRKTSLRNKKSVPPFLPSSFQCNGTVRGQESVQFQ